ncbi:MULTISPECIES: carboxymuconolactone decarboxylase family protein [Leeia]|uniref:Carboxymuconolactone decarboxylase family protein n=1 Tax=Leeia aquatica TaxID=2725557 RepID=A0A847SAP1_9NEIS|nr:carboxymuconolactone decarboxylase family protein [Leeia aquatica]NLR74148.1 carboxymuconolactone decarboxylase family protein [Leeia aquatica]
MSRLSIPALNAAPEASRPTLDAVNQQLGVVPNLFRLLGSSPAALNGFVSLQGALSKTLDVKTRERIALAVAQANGCDYCLSAHTYLGQNLVKLSAEEMALNRKGASGDAKAHAAVQFAAKVAQARGHVSDADIQAVRAAGYSDAQLVEMVALVTENTFTNFLNSVAQTEIDFPVVRAAEIA